MSSHIIPSLDDCVWARIFITGVRTGQDFDKFLEARMKKNKTATDDGFVKCEYDPFMGSFRLSLFYWVTFENSLKEFQLKAISKTINRALKKKRVK